MLSLLRKVKGKKSIITLTNYLSGEASIKVLGVLSIPLLTRMLSPSDFGLISVFNSITQILLILQSLNLQSSLRPRYLKSAKKFNEYFSTVFISSNIFSFIFCVLLIIFSKKISILIGIPRFLFVLAFIATTISISKDFSFKFLLAKNNSKKYALNNFLFNFLNTILSLLIIYFLINDKYLGRAYAYILSSLVYFIISIYILRSVIVFKFEWIYLKQALLFSVPLIFHTTSHYLLSQFDRIIIAQLVDTQATGIYSLVYTVGNLLMVIIIAVNNSWVPFFFKSLNNKEQSLLNGKIKIYLNIILFSSLLLSVFGNEIIMLFATKEYYDGIKLVPIFVLANLFIYLYMLFANYSFYSERTYIVALGTLISGLINLILNYIFIPIYGYKIAAVTTLISYIILFIIHYINARFILKNEVLKLLPIFKDFFLYILCYFGIFFIVRMFDNPFLISGIKILSILLFCLIQIIRFYKIYKKKIV